jgi:nitroreductase
MSFINLIKKRRSIRNYKSDLVSEEVLNNILEAARLAPSASNRQPWHFIVVEDRDIKSKLGLKNWAEAAPIIIVGCSDPEISSKWHIVDTSIAFEHIILAATSYGLGTCWIGSLDFEVVKKVLKIPDHMNVLAVTPLGYINESPEAKGRKSLSEIVHYEKF